jgi:hypothetical protein
MYGDFKFNSKSEVLTKQQLNDTMPAVIAKFEESFEPYYPSIKAPAIDRVQAQPESTATTEMQSHSPSFEQRLKTTAIGSGFTWLPDGELVLDRLLKHQAPFREQKTIVSTRKVQLIQSRRGVIQGEDYQNDIANALLGKEDFFEVFYRLVPINTFNPSTQSEIFKTTYTFFERPAQEEMTKLLATIGKHGIAITDDLSDLLKKHLNNSAKVENYARVLPQSFAGYLAKQSKADRGNLGMYSLSSDETRRGHQLLTSKEAILESDSNKGGFLPLPVSSVKKHLQKDDSESLFINSHELVNFTEEYAGHIDQDDL